MSSYGADSFKSLLSRTPRAQAIKRSVAVMQKGMNKAAATQQPAPMYDQNYTPTSTITMPDMNISASVLPDATAPQNNSVMADTSTSTPAPATGADINPKKPFNPLYIVAGLAVAVGGYLYFKKRGATKV